VIFLRKLVEGGTSRSYGIQVARLAGLPEGVLERAKEVLNNLEQGEFTEAGVPKLAISKNGSWPGRPPANPLPVPAGPDPRGPEKGRPQPPDPLDAAEYFERDEKPVDGWGIRARIR